MKQTRGIIFDIKRFAVHDGPGIRTTVFLKGCPMRCPWCHNPESWKLAPEKINGKANGTVSSSANGKETIGHETDVDAVMTEIEKEVIFYDESGGGVTFSGGEPLMQPRFLLELLKSCRAKEIHTALDTTGYADPAVFDRVVDEAGADLFLYDLKIIGDSAHMRHTGVSNQPVLRNLKSLCQKGRRVIVRFPVIPGYTDGKENVEALGKLVRGLNGCRVESIHLLPYHGIASGKFQRLGIKNQPEEINISPPSKQQMEELRNDLQSFSGVNVTVS